MVSTSEDLVATLARVASRTKFNFPGDPRLAPRNYGREIGQGQSVTLGQPRVDRGRRAYTPPLDDEE